MAARKMTFSLPEDLAKEFTARVPARARCQFVANVLRKSFEDEEEKIIQACKLANRDADVRAVGKEFERIEDGIEERWDDTEAR